MPSHLKSTTLKCVHLVTRGHFRSPDKDGGDIIRSAIAENLMPHANLLALCFIEAELLPIEVYIVGIFDLFGPVTLTLIRWPSYTNLTRIPWRGTGLWHGIFYFIKWWGISQPAPWFAPPLPYAVRDLGVILDSELSMQNHISKVTQTCFYHIRRLKQVRKLLGPDVAAELVVSLVFSRFDYCNATLAGFPKSTIAPLQRVENAASRLVARLGPYDTWPRPLKTGTMVTHRAANRGLLFKIVCWCTKSTSVYSAMLSPRVRHCISRRHFTASSAIHQQSAIWTGAHASEVRWTFVLVCRTKSLGQSPVFTARTHRHQNFQTQTKDLSFSAGLSLNLCIRFVFILFYFISSHAM